MADEVLDEPVDEAIEPTASRGRGFLRVVMAVAFVAVIVIVEIVAAAMLTPTADETERLARQLAAASAGESADSGEDKTDEHGNAHGAEDLREVELGVYNITRYNPSTNTTLAIDFELYGTVLASDAGGFQHHYENCKARVREQVTMTLHGAESADLTDAGLGLIKRRILEKTNRALGEPLLKEVLFSKFNFVER